MEKLKFYLATVILTALAMFMLQSCLEDNSNSYPYNGSNANTLFTIGTLKIIDGRDYCFSLDDGSKMYPSDTTNIHDYELVDGQRVFIQFLPLKESKLGYEYNVKLIQLENILTKDIIPLTEETADSIGNDRINVTELWVTGKYLNIEHQFFHSENPQIRHMLNMVINETAEAPETEDGYLNLEFRHNAYHDEQRKAGWGIVSFKLEGIEKLLEGKKGLKVLVNSIYDGKRTYTVELNNKK